MIDKVLVLVGGERCGIDKEKDSICQVNVFILISKPESVLTTPIAKSKRRCAYIPTNQTESPPITSIKCIPLSLPRITSHVVRHTCTYTGTQIGILHDNNEKKPILQWLARTIHEIVEISARLIIRTSQDRQGGAWYL